MCNFEFPTQKAVSLPRDTHFHHAQVSSYLWAVPYTHTYVHMYVHGHVHILTLCLHIPYIGNCSQKKTFTMCWSSVFTRKRCEFSDSVSDLLTQWCFICFRKEIIQEINPSFTKSTNILFCERFPIMMIYVLQTDALLLQFSQTQLLC